MQHQQGQLFRKKIIYLRCFILDDLSSEKYIERNIYYAKLALILIINACYIFLAFKIINFSYKDIFIYLFNHEEININKSPISLLSILICFYLYHILTIHTKNKDILNKGLIYRYTKKASLFLSFVLCFSASTDGFLYCLAFTLYFFHTMRLNITIKNKKITYYLILGFFNFFILILIFSQFATPTRPTF